MIDDDTLLEDLRYRGSLDRLLGGTMHEAADRIEELKSEIVRLRYESKRLRDALQHCVNAIAECEKNPEGIDGFLLGALDNALSALETPL